MSIFSPLSKEGLYKCSKCFQTLKQKLPPWSEGQSAKVQFFLLLFWVETYAVEETTHSCGRVTFLLTFTEFHAFPSFLPPFLPPFFPLSLPTSLPSSFPSSLSSSLPSFPPSLLHVCGGAKLKAELKVVCKCLLAIQKSMLFNSNQQTLCTRHCRALEVQWKFIA